MRPLSLIALLACSACTAPLEVPDVWGPSSIEDINEDEDIIEVNLSAATATRTWIDGTTTTVWAYNDSVPGPLIHGFVGQTLRVNFTNNLDEATTIHWHGLRINDEMDGVPAIQAPIEPGETFVYEFALPDAGTFWYHPHIRSHEQIERGLQGALVVHDPAEPVVDQQRYFVVDDALLEDNGSWAGFNPKTNHMLGVHGRSGNVLLVNGSGEALTDTIEAGAVERWRLVNTANARNFWWRIEGAEWRIIGVDGGLVSEPWSEERVLMEVGRRFDVEVRPRTGEQAKLVIDIPGQSDWSSFERFIGDVVGELPTAASPEWVFPEPTVLAEPQQEVVLELNAKQLQAFQGGGLAWTINGDRYEESDALSVTANTPTRIEIQERSGAFHPFHLHGQFFRVVERSGGPIIPGRLDTLLIDGDETVVIQTDFDNPGRWMAHCHILEHAELGMMTEIHALVP